MKRLQKVLFPNHDFFFFCLRLDLVSSWTTGWWSAPADDALHPPGSHLQLLLEPFISLSRTNLLLLAKQQYLHLSRRHGEYVPVWPVHPRRGAWHPGDFWETGGRRERGGRGGPGQSSASVRLPDGSAEAEGRPAAD